MDCLHPIRIQNIYGRDVIVPCRHCVACLHDKSLNLSNRLAYELQQYKYIYLITLTYNPKYVPRLHAKFFDSDPLDDAWLYAHSNSVSKHRKQLACDNPAYDLTEDSYITHIPRQLYEELSEKTHDNGYLYCFHHKDVQRWLKRVRKYLSESGAYTRYYIVSEFAPKHFRPHYHCVLYSNSCLDDFNLKEIISKTWQFGDFDFQHANWQTSSYVADYISGSTVLHPLSWRDPFKCKIFHSTNLACIPETTVFSQISQGIDPTTFFRNLWRYSQKRGLYSFDFRTSLQSVSSSCPKCPQSHCSNLDDTRLYLSVYANAIRLFSGPSTQTDRQILMAVCRYIARYSACYRNLDPYVRGYSTAFYQQSRQEFCQYLWFEFGLYHCSHVHDKLDYIQVLYQSLYPHFINAKKFINYLKYVYGTSTPLPHQLDDSVLNVKNYYYSFWRYQRQVFYESFDTYIRTENGNLDVALDLMFNPVSASAKSSNYWHMRAAYHRDSLNVALKRKTHSLFAQVY